MPLTEHLIELRRRLLWALAGIGVGAVAGWWLAGPIMDFMARPLGEEALNFPTVGAALDLRLRLAGACGVVLASPWWLWQAWAFIAPGLLRGEKRLLVGFFSAAVGLFGGGVAFGMWLAPRAVGLLLELTPQGGVNLLTASNYVTFYIWLVVAFGVGACLPLAVVAANFAGLASARQILRAWRWAVVVAFGFAAVANPLPDAWSMIAIGLVMTLVYLAAVGVCFGREYWLRRRLRAQ